MTKQKSTNKFIKFLPLVLLVAFSTACEYKPSTEKTKELQKIQLEADSTEASLDWPTHDPSLVKGSQVFKANCASCHAKADGKPGRIHNKEYMRTRSPIEQYETLMTGNKKGMPSFKDNLNREERWDALLYMRAEILGYYPLNSADLAEMDKIFGANCAVCHGTRGHGDGPLHKSLEPMPANFNQFSRLYTRTDNKLHHEISHGIPWTAMPAWKDRRDFDLHYSFDNKMVWKLVRYVRQFGHTQEVDRLDKGRQKIEEYKAKIGAK